MMSGSQIQHPRACNVDRWVRFGLVKEWSLEQISGMGKVNGHPVSHEWIYGYIQRAKPRGGKLYKQLRRGRRKYGKDSEAHYYSESDWYSSPYCYC